MDELLESCVRDIALAIRSKQVSAKEITNAFLDRINSVNPAINAVIATNAEAAIKQAEWSDKAIAAGKTPGKLFGVPMTIKDSLNTFDMTTTWGTLGRADFRPGRDATCVARLRKEGAILLGKTNTPEFTLSFKTDNLLFGKSNNPYDLSRTPGGSSGGAAAAIAARCTPFDIGTDTGGSIRLPSHFCGIAGIKPTTGRVPCTGNALPNTGLLAPLTQPGPMAKRVDDLIYLLETIQGPDFEDPNTVPATWQNPYKVDITSLRVGFHLDNGISVPDIEIKNAILTTIELLSSEGLSCDESRPTGLEMSRFIYSSLFAADNGELVDLLLGDSRTKSPSAAVAEIIRQRPTKLDATEFAQLIHLWHNYQSSMLNFFFDHDVLISPVNAKTAIVHEQQEDFSDYTYTAAYNLTGWPSVVIRAGTDSEGLPIGVQILAKPFAEHHALAIAAWLEARLNNFEGPALNIAL